MVVGPEWGGLECLPLPDATSFTSNDVSEMDEGEHELEFDKASGHTGFSQSTSVVLDNSLSPAHTLLQISCKDRRGLVYDCLRTLRDSQIQVVFGCLSTNSKRCADIDLFISEADGNKILGLKRKNGLSCRLELEIVQPIKVLTQNRGPDIDLLVATPMELSGRGRPRVLQDTTYMLRKLKLGIFQADLERRIIGDRNWEVYRFLIIERPGFISSSDALIGCISEQIKKILLL
eukprot:c33377_g1_i1 orf=329-1027(+)